MKTNPSEVFILEKIDRLNAATLNMGIAENLIVDGIDPQYTSDAIQTIKTLTKKGVLESVPGSTSPAYRLTGKAEGVSEEVKHYVKNRRIPH